MPATDTTEHQPTPAPSITSDAEATTTAPAPGTPSGRAVSWVAASAVASMALLGYLTYSLLQWRHGATPSWDLAIFTQAVRGYAEGGAPIVHLKGAGANQLGDHFSPALALLAPFYLLAPSPLTLVVIQNILIAGTVLLLAHDAVNALGRVRGVLIGVAAALSFGFIQGVAFQFHEVSLAAPLIAAALIAVRTRRFEHAALLAAPLVLVKEDLGLTAAVIGLLIALRGGRRTGLTLTGWGIAWFVITTTLIIPALNPTGWAYPSQLTTQPLLHNPWLGLYWFVNEPTKILTLLLLISITVGAGLKSPIALVAIPTLTWRMWSDNPSYWGHSFHYDLILMPILFIAATDTLTTAAGSASPLWRRYAKIVPITAVVIAAMNLPLTHATDLIDGSLTGAHSRQAARDQVLALIPDHATVETDTGVLTYLVARTDAYYIGRPGNPAPDFVIIDTLQGGWPTDPGDATHYAQNLHPGTTFESTYDQDGYRVARRN